MYIHRIIVSKDSVIDLCQKSKFLPEVFKEIALDWLSWA